MTNERTNAELIKAIRDEDKGLGGHAMLSARIIHNTAVVMQAAYIEQKHGKGADVAMEWITNHLDNCDCLPEEECIGGGNLDNANNPELFFRDNHLSGELSPYQSRMAPLIDELERRIELLQKSLDEANATLKAAREQEPVAFWWIGPDGDDNGGPYRGKPSDAAIDSARKMGCEPHLLYASPIPAPAVPAPSVPDGDDFNGTTPHMIQCIEALVRLDAKGVLVPHGIGRDASKLLTAAANRLRQQAPAVPTEWREVMAELASDLQAACDAEYPHRDKYPSVMRKYNNDMKIVEKARALLQSTEPKK